MRRLIWAAALACWLAAPAAAIAGDLLNEAPTAVVEDADPSGAASEPSAQPPGAQAAPSATAHPAKSKALHIRRRRLRTAPEVPTEPIDVRLEITEDSWAYEWPSQDSPRIKRIHAGKYVHVTALTPDYLRVELRDGRAAYVYPEVLKMVSPANKILTLSEDSAVRERPNKWAKQLAEVNKGHHVQVVGVAPGYVRIRMRSGLEGFIPYSVLQGGAANVPKTNLFVN